MDNKPIEQQPVSWFVKVLRGIVTVIDKINQAVGVFAAYTLVPLLLLMIWEVLARYVFQKPTIWGFDMSLWLFGMPALLAGGWCLKEKGHVNMDIVYGKVSPRGKAIMDCITYLAAFAFLGVMTVECWEGLMMAIRRSEKAIGSWQVIVWPVKMWMPVSCGLLFLQCLANYISNLYMAITGRSLR